MKTGLSQSTSLRQELKINPRLYQAMDLLYMPLLDLQQHLKQELLINPFLELIEPEEDDQEAEQENEEEGSTAATDLAEAPAPEAEPAKENEVDWEDILLDGFDTPGPREEQEEREARQAEPADAAPEVDPALPTPAPAPGRAGPRVLRQAPTPTSAPRLGNWRQADAHRGGLFSPGLPPESEQGWGRSPRRGSPASSIASTARSPWDLPRSRPPTPRPR